MARQPRKPAGVWTIDGFDDASGLFVTNWHMDGTHTCYADDGRVSQGAGCSYRPGVDVRIPYRLAWLIVRTWRKHAR